MTRAPAREGRAARGISRAPAREGRAARGISALDGELRP
jgi:hypothetical protein